MLDVSQLTDLEIELLKAGLSELPNSNEEYLEVIGTLYDLLECEYNKRNKWMGLND
jgi:hypothetical protein